MNSLRTLSAGILTLIAIALDSVSSPNYAAVLSAGTASSALAAVLFGLSSRSVAGAERALLRASAGVAAAISCYSLWGVISVLG
jgi:hypothetical protein